MWNGFSDGLNSVIIDSIEKRNDLSMWMFPWSVNTDVPAGKQILDMGTTCSGAGAGAGSGGSFYGGNGGDAGAGAGAGAGAAVTYKTR